MQLVLIRQSACGSRRWHKRHVHPAQCNRLITRQGVHRRLGDRESSLGHVHSQDVDRRARVRDSIARTARRGVPTRHGIRPTDVWELGERAQCGVVFALKTVAPIGTRDIVQREARVVVGSIVGERRLRLREDTKTGDEGEEGDEKGGKVVHRRRER